MWTCGKPTFVEQFNLEFDCIRKKSWLPCTTHGSCVHNVFVINQSSKQHVVILQFEAHKLLDVSNNY